MRVNALAGVEGISVTFFVEVRCGGWARYRAGRHGGQEQGTRPMAAPCGERGICSHRTDTQEKLMSRVIKDTCQMTRVAAAIFGVFLAAASTGEIAQGKYGFSITPHVGGQNATFVASFVAPRSTVKGDFYDASLYGPDSAYRSLAALATNTSRQGNV
jgi:hypothetical protein